MFLGILTESYAKYFFISRTEEGSTWTHKTIEIFNEKDSIISEYNDFTRLPEKIYRDNIHYHFQYNLKGVLEGVVSTNGDDIKITFNDDKNIHIVQVNGEALMLNYDKDQKPVSITYQNEEIAFPFEENDESEVRIIFDRAKTILKYGLVDI